MRIAWTPFTNIVSCSVANLASGAISTGWRGTGRTFVAQITTKRRAGKPIAAARMRGDWIVACVRELQRTDVKMDDRIVPMAASFFGVHVRTVWNALAEDRKPGPISLGSMRPITYTHTGTCLR